MMGDDGARCAVATTGHRLRRAVQAVVGLLLVAISATAAATPPTEMTDPVPCLSPPQEVCPEWRWKMDAGPSRQDHATDAAIAPDGGRLFVTGARWGGPFGTEGGGWRFAVAAIDAASGRAEWVQDHLSPGWYHDIPRTVAVSPDSRTVYVTGSEGGIAPPGFVDVPEGGTTLVTIAYDAASGEIRWTSRAPIESPVAVGTKSVASPDGRSVFITGYTHSGWTNGRYDMTTLALHAESGETQWLRTYDGPESMDDFPGALALTPDGDQLLVAGIRDGVQQRLAPIGHRGEARRGDAFVAAYDARTGQRTWDTRYRAAPGEGDGVNDMVLAPDASQLYVTGWSAVAGSTSTRYLTMALDPESGAVAWASEHGGVRDATGAPGTSVATALAVDPNGDSVFVTGTTWGAGHPQLDRQELDTLTLAYDAVSGRKTWEVRYDGPSREHESDEVAEDIVVTPDGRRVLVAGSSINHPGWSLPCRVGGVAWVCASPIWSEGLLLNYDAATGSPLWTSTVTDDTAPRDGSLLTSIVMDPEGKRAYAVGTFGPRGYAYVQNGTNRVYAAEQAHMLGAVAYPIEPTDSLPSGPMGSQRP